MNPLKPNVYTTSYNFNAYEISQTNTAATATTTNTTTSNNPPLQILSDPYANILQTIKCSLSLDDMQDPIMVIPCGHTFDGKMLHNWIAQQKIAATCPECRQRISTVANNIFAKNIVDICNKDKNLEKEVDQKPSLLEDIHQVQDDSLWECVQVPSDRLDCDQAPENHSQTVSSLPIHKKIELPTVLKIKKILNCLTKKECVNYLPINIRDKVLRAIKQAKEGNSEMALIPFESLQREQPNNEILQTIIDLIKSKNIKNQNSRLSKIYENITHQEVKKILFKTYISFRNQDISQLNEDINELMDFQKDNKETIFEDDNKYIKEAISLLLQSSSFPIDVDSETQYPGHKRKYSQINSSTTQPNSGPIDKKPRLSSNAENSSTSISVPLPSLFSTGNQHLNPLRNFPQQINNGTPMQHPIYRQSNPQPQIHSQQINHGMPMPHPTYQHSNPQPQMHPQQINHGMPMQTTYLHSNPQPQMHPQQINNGTPMQHPIYRQSNPQPQMHPQQMNNIMPMQTTYLHSNPQPQMHPQQTNIGMPMQHPTHQQIIAPTQIQSLPIQNPNYQQFAQMQMQPPSMGRSNLSTHNQASQPFQSFFMR
jgi:hypothetical protein